MKAYHVFLSGRTAGISAETGLAPPAVPDASRVIDSTIDAKIIDTS
jgi:hypothetical protein